MSADCKFAIIEQTLKEKGNCLNVSMLCEIAGVSRSGYYRWIKDAAKRAEREMRDRQDFELILSAYNMGIEKVHAEYICVCWIGKIQ